MELNISWAFLTQFWPSAIKIVHIESGPPSRSVHIHNRSIISVYTHKLVTRTQIFIIANPDKNSNGLQAP